MRTKHHAKKLAKQLTEAGIPAVDLHGNLSQPRATATSPRSPTARPRVLVATDVAARGVHVDDIELVVHVDPPMEHKAYLHRSGRTARAGSEGDVVTIVAPRPEAATSQQLMRKAAITVTPAAGHAESAAVTALVGEVAAYVKPAPRAARTASRAAADARRAPTPSASARTARARAADAPRLGFGFVVAPTRPRRQAPPVVVTRVPSSARPARHRPERPPRPAIAVARQPAAQRTHRRVSSGR